MAKNPYLGDAFNGLSEVLGESLRFNPDTWLGLDGVSAAARDVLANPALEEMTRATSLHIAEVFNASPAARWADDIAADMAGLVSPQLTEMTNAASAQIAAEVGTAVFPALSAAFEVSSPADGGWRADLLATQVGWAAGLASARLPQKDYESAYEAAAGAFPEIGVPDDEDARHAVGGLAHDWFGADVEEDADAVAARNRAFAETAGWIDADQGEAPVVASPRFVPEVAEETPTDVANPTAPDVPAARMSDQFEVGVEEAVAAVIAIGADLAITAGTLAWIRVVADAKRALGSSVARRIAWSVVMVAGAFTFAWWAVGLGATAAEAFMAGVPLLVGSMIALWKAMGD